jgi:hypothetical protein
MTLAEAVARWRDEMISCNTERGAAMAEAEDLGIFDPDILLDSRIESQYGGSDSALDYMLRLDAGHDPERDPELTEALAVIAAALNQPGLSEARHPKGAAELTDHADRVRSWTADVRAVASEEAP